MRINKQLYPRTIAVYRPNTQLSTAGGAGQGQPSQTGGTGSYWGASTAIVTDTSAGEVLIQAGIPCSIQATTNKVTGTGEVPSDAPGPNGWNVFIPLSAVAKGTIRREDILVDDEGNRYQVSADYWNSLGWRLGTLKLEN